MKRLAVFLGTGFGTGYLKPAPGTWGSLVGFAYLWGLLRLPAAAAGAVVLGVVALAIWSGGITGRVMGRKDPGEVVIDEIAAVPFAAWPMALLENRSWWVWLAVFIAWRISDVVKPYPAQRLEALPDGWGILADDLMSAVYVGLAFWGVVRLGWIA